MSTPEGVTGDADISQAAVETEDAGAVETDQAGGEGGGTQPVVEDTSFDTELKILLVGDMGVGKSALLMRFYEDNYKEEFITTIQVDFKSKIVQVDGQRVKLQIWDTAGQERFQAIAAAYFRNADGVLFVYDVTYESSFESITATWQPILEEKAPENCCVVLVAAKCDMPDEEREVSAAKGAQLGTQMNNPHVETSAKDNFGVQDAFVTLAREIITRRKLQGEPRRQEHSGGLPIPVPNANKPKPRCC